MTDVQDKDRLSEARKQGQAQFDSIREMVEVLKRARGEYTCDAGGSAGCPEHDEAVDLPPRDERRASEDDCRQRILEDALSVEVRSGWVTPGALTGRGMAGENKPAEYRILLCTGGPAVQIVGKLNEYGEPETAVMQVQDWFTPWTEFCPACSGQADDPGNVGDPESILLEYARQFYFGE